MDNSLLNLTRVATKASNEAEAHNTKAAQLDAAEAHRLAHVAYSVHYREDAACEFLADAHQAAYEIHRDRARKVK